MPANNWPKSFRATGVRPCWSLGLPGAEGLGADFSVLVTRKLPYPQNPEAGFGAVAEDGSIYLSEEAARTLPDMVVAEIVEAQEQEVRRRVRALRGGDPLPDIRARTVITGGVGDTSLLPSRG
jgi:putative phosphoribosyl transferase